MAGIRKSNKSKIIDQIITLVDESSNIHDTELKDLYDNDYITYGSYWYLLNINKSHGVREFYGLDSDMGTYNSMLLNQKKHNSMKFKLVLDEVKRFIKIQKLVVETKTHDLDACRQIR